MVNNELIFIICLAFVDLVIYTCQLAFIMYNDNFEWWYSKITIVHLLIEFMIVLCFVIGCFVGFDLLYK